MRTEKDLHGDSEAVVQGSQMPALVVPTPERKARLAPEAQAAGTAPSLPPVSGGAEGPLSEREEQRLSALFHSRLKELLKERKRHTPQVARVAHVALVGAANLKLGSSWTTLP